MAESKRQLLSIGVFLLIIVAVILLVALAIIEWTLIIPLILVLSGMWMVILAGVRSSSPQKYEQSAFNTMGLGLFMIAVGGAWYLFGINWLYSLALILLVLAAIAIAAALKRK